jgi:hypothetical protein
MAIVFKKESVFKWSMIRLLSLFLCVCLVGCGASPKSASTDSPESSRPNIILVMADDLGWGDVAYNGHPIIKTPNLDAMAASGLRFNRFYAGAPVCSPTRGSVLTGRHPSRYGIPTANQGHLEDEEVSLAEVMKSQGYATGHFGKWHLGTMTPDYSGKKGREPEENYSTPGTNGSDEWFATEYAVATWDPYDPANAHDGVVDPRVLYWENGKNVVNGVEQGLVGCDSRIIMDKALPFIEKQVKSDTPFLPSSGFMRPTRLSLPGLSIWPCIRMRKKANNTSTELLRRWTNRWADYAAR